MGQPAKFVRLPAAVLRFALLFCLVMASNADAVDLRGTIRIGGTGGASASVKELAKTFQKRHHGVNIVFVPSLGSTGGINAVIAGSIDLGLSSRTVKDSELRQGAVAVRYARTPFVFVTAHKVDGAGFTLSRMTSIYSGEIKSWPDGAPIRVILRPENDSDTYSLRSMSAEMAKAVRTAISRQGMIIAMTDQESADAVEKIRGSIGTSTLTQIISEKRALNLVPLNGVTPSAKTLANGTYPFYKDLFLVTRPRPPALVKTFVEFVTSPEGKAILTRTGNLADLESRGKNRQ